MSATPWYIATGRAVRRNPNGPAGIIRSDVPDGTEYVGVEWSDGHSSMQPVAELIRWEPQVGDLVVMVGSTWVDMVASIKSPLYFFVRASWCRFIHEIRPKMVGDAWVPVPGEVVRVRSTGEQGVVRPSWSELDSGFHRVSLTSGGESRLLPYELAPVAPMRDR